MNIKIVSSGNEEIFPFAIPIGIGLIESAMNLTRMVLFDKPDLIIFIGSAGSYGNKTLFEVVESSSASQIELSFLEKNSYTPIENIIANKNEVIVNSSNYITTSALHSKAFLKLGIELENMEFFSLVKICKEFEIPIKGFFVVTNYCNENAHQDYLKNIKKAKEKLIKYLEEKKIIKAI